MLQLHALLDFTDGNWGSIESDPNYWYQGRCPHSGKILRLPRTGMSEALARGLMKYLAADDSYSREGKMYGVLLVETPWGEKRILKAFSGLMNGCSTVEGWVPPIPGRDRVAFEEARTLTELDAIKQQLMALKQLPQRQQYDILCCEFESQLQVLSERHRNCKQQRDAKRQLLYKFLTEETLVIALEKLNQESRSEGIKRRQLKRNRDETLQPLKQLIEAADARIGELKQKRKELSRELQTQMHAAYSLVNFLGKSRSIQELMPAGSIPTGTGDCCAPKLLHCAALHNLEPLGMAEFWWGPPSGDKIQGEFYGACADRCQPLMGFLLSGLAQNPIVSNQDLEAEPPDLHSQAEPIGDNLRLKPIRNVAFRRSLDPPKSPLIRGTLRNTLVPPLLRGARGDLDLDTTRETVGLTLSCHQWAEPGNEMDFDGGTGILPVTEMLPIIYEDKWLIAVNKPSGLLSVPGRYFQTQDSVLSRLQNLLTDGEEITAVHRLD
jgi:tRNA pseudouridine32 synthase/23S rRNA pseudouridine746 synthase